MLGKKDNDYFKMLAILVDHSYESAVLLNDILVNFNINDIEKRMNEMHEIENTADKKKHELINKLAKEFITPIDRGDIMQLASYIDDVTDDIDEILAKIYMYNIKEIREEAMEFSNIIINSCEALKKIMKEFNNFKKSSKLNALIIEMNDLENLADKLYFNTIRKLYTVCKDPIELMIWTDTFNIFEKCCDSCEAVANAIESVVIENS